MHGFTDNYIKVSVLFDKEKVNQIAIVTLNDFDEAGNVKATIVQVIFLDFLEFL